jgi:WD40 repeat protein
LGDSVNAAVRAWAVAHARSVARRTVVAGPAEPDAPSADRPEAGPTVRPNDLFDLVSEHVPEGWTEVSDNSASAVSIAVSEDGRLLLATGYDDGGMQIWDAQAGILLHDLTTGVKPVRSVAWAVPADGPPLLAMSGGDGAVLTWDGHTGALRRNLATDHEPVRSVAWAVPADGAPLLAAGGADGHVRVWDEQTGALRHDLTGDGRAVRSVAWARPVDGQLMLAMGGAGRQARIWDGRTGTLLHVLAGHAGEVNSVAWAASPGSRMLLATGSDDGHVRVWDGQAGTLRHTFAEPSGSVYSVAWGELPDGRLLLGTSGNFAQSTTRVWDGSTFERLVSLPGSRGTGSGLAWALPGKERALLGATPGMSNRRARLWSFRLMAPGSARRGRADRASTPVPSHSLRPIEAGLLALGGAGLWAPLGLIDDLVTLTGPGLTEVLELNDGRLRVLAGHPGVRQLRDLGWPVQARLSFAGLLASCLTARATYVPPATASIRELRDTLNEALADSAATRPADVDLKELRTGAEQITDQIVALLTILGPEAVAADPALPLRLAHHAPGLPALAISQLLILSETTKPGTVRLRASDGGERRAPGTVGVGRHGNLTQLLATQLALPADLLRVRYLQSHLLYRRHTTRIPPTPEPVTFILDTTPPTYGPAENVLRLAAHLITAVLWDHGEHPVLISLTRPDIAIPLTRHEHLAQLWTSRTLDPPGPTIAAALETAPATGSPIVLLAHHQAPSGRYVPSEDRRLLTTHQPPEPPPSQPSNLNHYHLPPDPTQAHLLEVVWAILSRAGGSR